MRLMSERATCRAVPLPSLVCIVGIDGSGKTTLARAVIDVARQSGVSYRYAWANAQPIFMRPVRWIVRHTVLRDLDMFRDYGAYRMAKQSFVQDNHFARRLHPMVFVLDYVIWMAIRVGLPLLFGERIVCDRYVHDVAISTGLLFGKPVSTIQEWIDMALRVLPRPALLFWVDVPEHLAMQRKSDVPSIGYLQERRRLYAQVMQKYHPIPVDGTRSVDSLAEQVWDEVTR